MLKIVKITKVNLSVFRYFLKNNYKIGENDICFGAIFKSEVPCAVIIARYKERNTWCVENFFVLSKARNVGIGSALLSTLRIELKKKKCVKLYFRLIMSKRNLNSVLNFLKNRGFPNFKILCKIYKKKANLIWEESKFVRYMFSRRKVNLPKIFKIIKLEEITDVIKENTIEDESSVYPSSLSPFINENKLEDANSSFVLDVVKNKLVAWLTSFNAPKNTILYRSFFTNSEYRKYNFGKMLLRRAIRNHKDIFFNKCLLFAVSTDNIKVDKALTRYFMIKKENTSYEVIIE